MDYDITVFVNFEYAYNVYLYLNYWVLICMCDIAFNLS